MSAIAGLFDTRGQRDFDPTLIERINASLRHRGPDRQASHLEAGLALGHCELRVARCAPQPLLSADGRLALVLDGELYNRSELLEALDKLGLQPRTPCDGETILLAWQAWGEDCLKRLRGVFAFALHDREQGSLNLVRDQLALKPLFYSLLADGTLIFGSELKALLRHPGVERRIDPLAVEEYFALGYVADPRSIFSGVFKLEPGELICVRRNQPGLRKQRYWDLNFSLDRQISLADACEELTLRVRKATAERMEASVELGAFLSGGVDSSAVVATMAGLSASPVNTCSIAFDDPKFNEAEFARMVADRYQTRHRVEEVKSDDFGLIDRLVSIYDEPYADSSALPTFRVCELARKHLGVALSGDGGDELMGGYRRYRMHLMEERMRSALPLSLRQPLFGLLGRIYPKADWAPRMFRAKTTFQAMARDAVAAYFHSVSIVRGEMREQLFSASFKQQLGGYEALEVFRRHAATAGTDDPLALIQYLDLHAYGPGDTNTKVDRASMANSLLVRAPLMDTELVDWLCSLPSSLKISGNEGKYLFKKAMEPHLPHDVLYRPKMGFSVPLSRWFRGPLKTRVREAVLGETLAATGIFNRNYLEHLVDAHQNGVRDYSASLWTLLMFEGFMRSLDRDVGTGPA
ncbi:MAG: amidotransferase 1, exosortase A system-associated [Thauera sp.]|jgi:asparagine synthase (glutamine-hydrolysing)|nr:amidotransferase 1, exosortase A system-associated [Thauera sp.]